MLHFATYFDTQYASRGLSLLASLRRQCQIDFKLYILCLDEETYQFFNSRRWRDVVPVSRKTLFEFDTSLKHISTERDGADLIFTMTPCFISYLFETVPEADLITYLDADIYFFSSPETTLKEIGNSSIAIIEHRFSPKNFHLRAYGIFNVGWVTWRRDAQGLKCLKEYRADCLNWCHDELDGCNFADQRYLDRWPSLYTNLCVISQPGANTAPWNIDRYPLSVDGKKININGSPLVFFHFHKFSLSAEGTYATHLENYIPEGTIIAPEIISAIYAPYAKRVRRLTSEGKTVNTGIRYHKQAKEKHYKSHLPQLEKATEIQDCSAVLGEPGMADYLADGFNSLQRQKKTKSAFGIHPTQKNRFLWLSAMMAAGMSHNACQGKNKFTLLDWGISIGNCSMALQHFFATDFIEYTTCTLSSLAKKGMALGAPCQWLSMPAIQPLEAAAGQYDIILSGSSLHYAFDWEQCLASLLQNSLSVVGLYDVALVSSTPSYRMTERMYNDKREMETQAWAINITELETIATAYGFIISAELPALGIRYCEGAQENPEYRGLLLRRL